MHNVKLISYSQPTKEIAAQGIANIQELIAYCARVSNPSNELNLATSKKLIEYLIDSKHFSTLEMVSACMLIETTRDISRQILRHRSFSFQEFSQRYSNPLVELDMSTREARMQDSTNRQNSFPCDNDAIKLDWQGRQEEIMALTSRHYKWAINIGIAKECARVVLPEGLTMTKLYMNGTIRSWLHFLEVRLEKGTQLEAQQVAAACAQAISEIFPMITTQNNT